MTFDPSMFVLAALSASLATAGARAVLQDPGARRLEDAILSCARAHTTDEARPPVRRALGPLVEDRLDFVPESDEAALPHVAVGRRTEWSDIALDPRADASAVFQVLSPAGRFWTRRAACMRTARCSRTSCAAPTHPQARRLAIRFADDDLLDGRPAAGADLAEMARRAEAQELAARRIVDCFACMFEGYLNNFCVSDRMRLVRSELPEGTILFAGADAPVIPA